MLCAVPRGYHSTAILLPDGRILCAGGNVLPSSDNVGDLYCPPYLFDTNGNLRTRPTLLGATGRWRYGASVAFAVPTGTSIASACLIHAGATTHAQDQAQRYVPVTLTTPMNDGNGHLQYIVTAPADSFVAPPGDYLFFVNDTTGVPAIAQWVRVGSTEVGQLDTTAPDTLSLSTEFISCDAIYPISWAAPGDDHAAGIALDYDVRYSTSPITEGNFASATPITGLPIPMLSGTVQNGDDLTSLQTCTNYYFAGKTRDRAGNWSALGRVKYKTLCVGICGLGESMRRETGANSLAPASPTLSSLLDSSSPLRLVGNFQGGEAPSWTLRYEDLSGATDLLQSTRTGTVVQSITAAGWVTRSKFSSTGGVVGVRSLQTDGRVIFPIGASLAGIELHPLGFSCTSALHSQLGDLLASSTSDLSSQFDMGDTLSMSFTASGSETEGNDCFLTVVLPTPAQAAAGHRGGADAPGTPTTGLPSTFALHSAHPNPFSRATMIRYDLPRPSEVRIDVFDVQGRHVATLLNGSRSAGRQLVKWNGVVESGERARAGVYLCRMSAGTFTAEQRMTLLP